MSALSEEPPAPEHSPKGPFLETPEDEEPDPIPAPTSEFSSKQAPQSSFGTPEQASATNQGAPQSFTPATIADTPASEDELGFAPYTRALAQFLLNSDTKGPLTVSVEGEWGSGKSSFLLILENDLKKGSAEKVKRNIPHNVPVIAKFNPWRHDKDEALWAAFAVALTKEIVKDQRWFQRLAGHGRLLLSRFDWKHGWLELLKAATVFLIATGLLFSLLALTAEHGPGWLFQFAKNVNISSAENREASPAAKEKEAGGTASEKPAGDMKTSPAAKSEPSQMKGTEWFTWLSGFGFFGAVAAYLIAMLFIVSKLKSLLSAPLSVNLAKNMKSPDYASRISFIEEFHEDFARVVHAFARGRTVFVFVDDLDRSSVTRASELMQAINMMISTELKNIIFILAMDREKIAAGVAVKNAELLPYIYPQSVIPSDPKSLPPSVGLRFGFEYLEKFIQIAFPLPKPRAENIDRFLKSLSGPKQTSIREVTASVSPDITSPAPSKTSASDQAAPATANEAFQIEFSTDSQNVRDVARQVSRFFDDNPRRLKQFVNIFRLRAFVAYETGVLRPGRMTAEQLGKLVAMQLRWPLWTATIFNDPSFLTKLAGNSPLDLAAGEDIELKKELIGLGRYNAPPGAAWNLEGADLEAFVRISPIVRPVDLDGNQISKQQTVPDALILWVDDKPKNNGSLRDTIEQNFYAQITIATSTARALELAATTRYQLIISDMGRLDDRAAGFSLLNQLRSSGINTPFLIFSARSTPQLRAEAQRLGALDFTNRDDVVINTVASLVTQKSVLSFSDAKSGSEPDEGRVVGAHLKK